MLKKLIICTLLMLSALLFACQPTTDTVDEPATPDAQPTEESVESEPSPTEEVAEPTAEPTSPPPSPTEDPKFPATSTPVPADDQSEEESSMDEFHSNPKVASAISDLTGRMNITSDAVKILLVEEKTWPDSSLGCPQEGMMYMQMLVEGGMLIQLEVDGKVYNYHAGPNDDPFLCEQPKS